MGLWSGEKNVERVNVLHKIRREWDTSILQQTRRKTEICCRNNMIQKDSRENRLEIHQANLSETAPHF